MLGNMQSKAKIKNKRKRKPLILLLLVAIVGVFGLAMMKEPKLVQTQAEQALDASQFKQ